ncbi:uncharacterized protein PITG_04305 [Phytophthora infestans T30-4]|uniref:Uncharacterized protein n=1 Tax=Phytophthora infestans (strain T30-4) TaxID=403677 RepID=D0N0Z4_PHYIT|nr:uncharacterized protein PITG_04305 [Phytophthora infestans T30-4]EEY67307.1 hypothetical protein PITG_04305 [Phytophthora infestans T30-4]|eukprot:XP_002905955.1 hypothetical protein PITG_04305 [Phytophthora infestans T30-4]
MEELIDAGLSDKKAGQDAGGHKDEALFDPDTISSLDAIETATLMDMMMKCRRRKKKKEYARQVDIINVPKPKRRGRPRTTSKQLTQTKLPVRLAVHKYPSGLTVSLDRLLVCARNTPNLNQFVNCVAGFYDVKTRTKSWIKDRKWLEHDWRKVPSGVN